MPADDGPVEDDGPIRAAGVVLWRNDGGSTDSTGGVRVGLVHRPSYDDWSLPKGKLDDGETPAAAAAREVLEETGHRVALGRRLGRVSYVVTSPLARQTGPKVVDYWAARSVGGDFRPNAEVDELRWLPAAQARELLSYDFDRTVLDSFAAAPAATATVLLVRHGKAGSRSKWHGDDDLRPLTAAGCEQAARLCSLLSLFGPSAVHSAPLVRCVQTVLPLAEALGVEVVEEPLLSEDGYWADRDAGLRRFLELAEAGGTLAVCSQGDVIPDLVGALAGQAAAETQNNDGDVPSRKGSAWVLSFRGTRCVAADYYERP